MKSVTILMGTHNGARFISEQLDTIARQTFVDWSIVISDDGSSDETLSIISNYAASLPEGRLQVRLGPRTGFCRNFLALACNPGVYSAFYAFSDQDDLWHVDKITRAIDWFENVSPCVPALYCSRTRIIDETGKELGLSPLFKRPPSFQNALVQNIGGGNTMVFNEAARRLLVKAGADVDVPSHDWWLYILVSGAGGNVHYDPKPTLDYRQHRQNIVGANDTLYARIQRLKKLLAGRLKYWSDLHVTAISQVTDIFSPESLETMRLFDEIRKKGFLKRMRAFYKSKIYRQTIVGQAGLYLAVMLRKL